MPLVQNDSCVDSFLRLPLHEAGSVWNCHEIGTDKPCTCVYTEPGRSTPDRFSYPVPNGSLTKMIQFGTAGDGWGYSDQFFLHIFVSIGYPISHKIIKKCPFMQTDLALQHHGESFFPAGTQCPEISSFCNIFAISE